MSNKIFVTKEGLENLKNELENLKTVKRVEIADKLKEAISFGDLSENSEYEEARNEQAQVEKRIIDLEEQLKNVELIDEKDSKGDKINMGVTVEIENINTKVKEKFKIVGSTEADILSENPSISNDSAVGKALLGKKKGDVVKIKTQAGIFEYKILNLK